MLPLFVGVAAEDLGDFLAQYATTTLSTIFTTFSNTTFLSSVGIFIGLILVLWLLKKLLFH